MPVSEIFFIRQKYTPFGGAERYLERLNAAFEAEGYRTEILHARLSKWLPSWLKALLFSRQVCKQKSKIRPSGATTPQERGQNPKSKILFSLDRITCPDIYRAGDGVHRAFLETKGFTLNPLHLSYLWLEKRTFENATLIIANSRLVKEQILRHYPQVDEKKIHVVYNGVPLPDNIDKAAAKKSMAAEFAFDPRVPILLFVGSGFERKGVREFLRIVARLENPVRAFVVGKEKRIERYKKLAEELKISERVIFTGPRKDVERFYEAADIFLFPTRYEPFSNVVPEALSYGNITFTTRQNGASEVLPPEWVMKSPGDFEVAARIDRLLTDPRRCREAAIEAEQIAEQYPIQRNVLETLALIQNHFG